MSSFGASKLLVVDDDPDVGYSFGRVFRAPDYEVIEARSGEQALGYIRSAKPDVILMDVRMPGAGGMATLRKIKDSGCRIPVVLMTAFGSVRIASEAVHAGAFDCIMKPFDVSRIRQVVAAALEASRKEKQASAHRANAGRAQSAAHAGAAAANLAQTSSPQSEAAAAPQIAGEQVFDLLFEELARRQPLPEGLDAFDVVERHLIGRALESCKGNQSRAARFLGITRNTLRKRIQKYGFAAGRGDMSEDDE